MIDYIRKKNEIVYINDEVINKTINIVLNSLAKENFKTIKSLKKVTREKLKIKRDVPLYINDEILLIPIREDNDDISYINVLNIDFILKKEGETLVVFKSKREIELSVSSHAIDSMLKKKRLIEGEI